MQQIFTPQGRLTLSFAYETLPLGFSLKLLKFTHGLNPGGMGDASFSSSVLLIDPLQNIHQQHEINMNEPLVHGRYTFYQSSFQESARRKDRVDPYRGLRSGTVPQVSRQRDDLPGNFPDVLRQGAAVAECRNGSFAAARPTAAIRRRRPLRRRKRPAAIRRPDELTSSN